MDIDPKTCFAGGWLGYPLFRGECCSSSNIGWELFGTCTMLALIAIPWQVAKTVVNQRYSEERWKKDSEEVSGVVVSKKMLYNRRSERGEGGGRHGGTHFQCTVKYPIEGTDLGSQNGHVTKDLETSSTWWDSHPTGSAFPLLRLKKSLGHDPRKARFDEAKPTKDPLEILITQIVLPIVILGGAGALWLFADYCALLAPWCYCSYWTLPFGNFWLYKRYAKETTFYRTDTFFQEECEGDIISTPGIEIIVGSGFENPMRTGLAPSAVPSDQKTNSLDMLEKLHGLKTKGILTEEEYVAAKAKLLMEV